MKLRLSLRNSDAILKDSGGEVVLQDTFNYRNFTPIPGGLFCPEIFGEERTDFFDSLFSNEDSEKSQDCTSEERKGDSIPSGHIELPLQIINPIVFHNKLEELLDTAGIPRMDFFNTFLFEDSESRQTYNVRIDGRDFAERFTKEQIEFHKAIWPETNVEVLLELDPCSVKQGVVERIDYDLQLKTGLKVCSILTSDIDELIDDRIPGAISVLYGVEGASFMISKCSNYYQDRFSQVTNHKITDWLSDYKDTIISRIPVIPTRIRPIIDRGDHYETSVINDLYRHILNSCKRFRDFADSKHYRLFRAVEGLNIQYKVNNLFRRLLSDSLTPLLRNVVFNLDHKSVRFSKTIPMIPDLKLSIDECVLDLHSATQLFFGHSLAEHLRCRYQERSNTHQCKESVLNDSFRKNEKFEIGLAKSTEVILISALNELVVCGKHYNSLSPQCRSAVLTFFNEYASGKCILLTMLDKQGKCRHFALKIKRIESRGKHNICVHPEIFSLANYNDANIYSIVTEEAQKELKNLLLPSKQNYLPNDVISEISVAVLYEMTRFDREGKFRVICSSSEELENAVELRQLSYYDFVIFNHSNERIETTIGRFLANELLPETYRDYDSVFDVEFLKTFQFSIRNDECYDDLQTIREINNYCDRIGSRMAIDLTKCRQRVDVYSESSSTDFQGSFMKCFRFAGATYITKKHCGSEGTLFSSESTESVAGKTIAANVSIPMSKNTDMMILFNKGDLIKKTEIDTLKKLGVILPVVICERIAVNEIHRLIESYKCVDVKGSRNFGKISDFTLNKENIEIFTPDDIIEVQYYPADGFILLGKIPDCDIRAGSVLRVEDLRHFAQKGIRVIKALPPIRVCNINDCKETGGICAYCYGEFRHSGKHPPVGTNIGALASQENRNRKSKEVLKKAFQQRHSLDVLHRLYFTQNARNTIYSSLFGETEVSREYLSPISRAYLGISVAKVEELK